MYPMANICSFGSIPENVALVSTRHKKYIYDFIFINILLIKIISYFIPVMLSLLFCIKLSNYDFLLERTGWRFIKDNFSSSADTYDVVKPSKMRGIVNHLSCFCKFLAGRTSHFLQMNFLKESNIFYILKQNNFSFKLIEISTFFIGKVFSLAVLWLGWKFSWSKFCIIFIFKSKIV